MTRRFETLPDSFFRRPAEKVAPALLGRYLVRRVGESRLVLRLVETEAYLGVRDRASHAWKGRLTRRTATLFRSGGCAYVYLIYGMWNCLNAVAGREGEGDAVLFRAGEVVAGEKRMRINRALVRPPRPGDVAGGPGKLCQALEVDRSFDGVPLDGGALRVTRGDPVESGEIAVDRRVGIAYAGEAAGWPLRFALRGCPQVSRPHPW